MLQSALGKGGDLKKDMLRDRFINEIWFYTHSYIKPTLYELIEVVSAEIYSDEEQWVPLIVDHMLGSCKSVHQV